MINLEHLKQWIGPATESEDHASLRHAHLMAATLGRDASSLQRGSDLPPLWHWIYFLEGLPAESLGRDGHPARGGFLPPVPLPNRMWAGGRVEFHAAVPLGAAMRKVSRVLHVEHKRGRTGDLVFVTVQHEVHANGVLCITEEHDIVYKEAVGSGPSPAGAAAAPPPPMAMAADVRRAWTPSSTQLFRYSALTFNGHRIHYDLDYCRTVEGYDNLVVHGPLSATLLAALGQAQLNRPLRRFHYRGLRPFVLGPTVQVCCHWMTDGSAELWTELPDGQASMRARAWA